LVRRQGGLYIELSAKRNVPENSYTEAVVNFSHSSVLFYATANLGFPDDPSRDRSPETLTSVGGTWDTQVKALTVGTVYWAARIGQTVALFDPDNKDYYYMTVASVTPGVEVFFNIIGEPLPLRFRGVSTVIFICHTTITGLGHLEGKQVSVVSDFVVESSPNNDIDNYPVYTVTGGQITLPTPRSWSIVGLPYTSDIETLAVDTRNGTMSLDAKIVNDVVVRYVRTRGGYVAGTFTSQDKVAGMEQGYEWETTDIVNKPLAEKTRSIRYRPSSQWELNGKICIRQVDPLPLEVSSIILDVSKG
jgi:hypothetical protein